MQNIHFCKKQDKYMMYDTLCNPVLLPASGYMWTGANMWTTETICTEEQEESVSRDLETREAKCPLHLASRTNTWKSLLRMTLNGVNKTGLWPD